MPRVVWHFGAKDDVTRVLHGIGRAQAHLAHQMNNFSASTAKSAQRSALGFVAASSQFVRGAQFMTASVGAAAGAITALGLKTFASMEQAQVGFEGMIGSAKAATQFMAKLKSFAIATPFDFEDLTQISRLFMGMGIAVKDVIPILTAFGNVGATVGLTSDQLKGAMVQLAQAFAKGKLQMQDMRFMAENGIPIIDILAKTLHKTHGEIFAMSEKGELLTSTVMPKVIAHLNSGGKYAGGMARAMDTLKGRFQKFTETTKFALRDAAVPMAEWLKDILPRATTIAVRAIRGFSAAMKSLRQGAMTFRSEFSAGMRTSGVAGQRFSSAFGPAGPRRSPGVVASGGRFSPFGPPGSLPHDFPIRSAQLRLPKPPIFTPVQPKDVSLVQKMGQAVRVLMTSFQIGGTVSRSGFLGVMQKIGITARQVSDWFQTRLVPAIINTSKWLGNTLGPAAVSLWHSMQNLAAVLKPIASDLAPIATLAAKAGIAFAKFAIEGLAKLVQLLEPVTRFLKEHKTVVNSLVVGVLAGVVAFKLLGPAIAGIKGVASLALAAFNGIRFGIFAITYALHSLKVAFATNPLGLAVVAIIALGAAFVYAYKHSETFRGIVDKVATSAGASFSKMARFALIGIKFMVNVWITAVETFVVGAATMFGWVPGIGPKLKKAAEFVKEWKEKVNTQFDGAIAKTNEWDERLTKMNKIVKLQGDIRDVNKKLATAESALKKTTDKKRIVELKADIKRLLEKKAQAQRAIDTLRGKTVPVNIIVSVNGMKVSAPGFRQTGGRLTRRGGLILGPGGPTADKIPAMLSSGEYVIRARSARKLGTRFLNMLNQVDALGGDTDTLRLMKFAQGGTVPSVMSWIRRQAGKPYVWGGAGPRGYDCSGFVGAAMAALSGRPFGSGQRYFTTASLPSMARRYGLVPGRGLFTIGNSVAGGHMSGSLAGMNFEATPPRLLAGRVRTPESSFSQHFTLRHLAALTAAQMAKIGMRIGTETAQNVVKQLRVKLADRGTILNPGLNLVANQTGRPEALTPVGQGGNIFNIVINTHKGMDEDAIIRVIQKYAKNNGAVKLIVRTN